MLSLAGETFVPCYLFTVVPAPYFRRFAKNESIKAFVAGVSAAATGAIAGAAFVLGLMLSWITVVKASGLDELVAVDPLTAHATMAVSLPGCDGAHGLRLHPDGKSALVACEDNAKVVRVDLVSADHRLASAASGSGPDVLAIDPGLLWLYVAAESGDLSVFDLAKPGLVRIDSEHPGDDSHSISVDAETHRVFFPLLKGSKGTPVLRIMKPVGT